MNHAARRWLLIRCLLALPIIAAAASLLASPAEFDHSHSAWTAILSKHVQTGLVDYAALKSNPSGLRRYLDSLQSVPREEFLTWTNHQQLAFLINLYNAATVKLVVDHYPVGSIKMIGGFLSSPWDLEVVNLFGARITLDELEHEEIRKNYKEPRVHFALVCAAKGCPALRGEAYSAANLDAALDEEAREFLANPDKNRFDVGQGVLHLSPLFKWYAADFEAQAGSILEYVKPLLPGRDGERFDSGPVRIQFTDYDWSLNEQPH